MEDTLWYKLNQLADSDAYPFHMPGHKRRLTENPWKEICSVDITEIDGFDNLHHAQDILRWEQDRISRIYGSRESFLLINGSSCGVLAAICSATSEQDEIIVARNSHKSAYHALYLQHLKPHYVYPQVVDYVFPYGGILAEDIKEKMDQTQAKVVFVTSPTYEGVISDLSAIADIVHERGGVLIVDEAHGAHLAFHPAFGKSAVDAGADIVIQSLHKTMPAMTQTALLHICSDRVDASKVKRYLGIFQTSSPSYVLMASISKCMSMVEEEGKTLFDTYVKRLQAFYEKAGFLQHLQVLDEGWFRQTYQLSKDISKIVIVANHLEDENGKRFHGPRLYETLRDEYHLQMEMQMGEYVLAMTSVMDFREGFDRLLHALFEIDSRVKRIEGTSVNTRDRAKAIGCETTDEMRKTETGSQIRILGVNTIPVTGIYEAMNGMTISVPIEKAEGRVSSEYLYLYPPGTPLLVPGERITTELLNSTKRYGKLGLTMQGLEDTTLRTIKVLC